MSVQLCDLTSNRDHLPQRIERKFYLSPEKVDSAYGLLRSICRADGNYPAEQINSLYFDTANLDQYDASDSGELVKNKVRIRWYGRSWSTEGKQAIYLELKSRRGFSSTKQRLELQVPSDNLTPAKLSNGIISNSVLSDTLFKFGYFPAEPLLPIIEISYWRYRFVEVVTGYHIAIDCHIRSSMVMPGIGYAEHDLELPGGVMEIKGSSMELPVILRIIKALDINWSRFSKYSSCLDSHMARPGATGRLSPSGITVK